MKHKWLLGIIVLASVLRLVGLNTHPVGFTPDEASFGYDAYSILHTGRDQWGNLFPLTLKSFGDYKMPLYTYLSIPSIALFGLNIFATRLPNAIFGILAVLSTYLFTKELFKDNKLALITSLLLAISPWHIALSRGAFEANLTTFFLTTGLYFLIKARENARNYLYAFVFLGLNLFSYHTARILTFPIIILTYFLLLPNYKKAFVESRKYFAVLIGFLVSVFLTLVSGAGGRLATANIFSLSENVFNDRVRYINAGQPELLAKLAHNKLTFVTEIFVAKYLEYFSPQFLFLEGAREATYGMIPGVGVLHFFELVSIAFAIYYLVRNLDRKWLFIIIWICLSAFPAALSLGPGLASNRVAFMMPAIQILSALGLLEVYKLISKHFSKKLVLVCFSVIISISTIRFIELQWFVQPVRGAEAMFASTQEAIEFVDSVSDQYDQIIIDKKLSEAHMFLAFYNKVDPRVFQEASKDWQFEKLKFVWVDQMPEYNLGRNTIRNIDWQRDLREVNALILFKAGYLPENIKPIKTIYFPDKTPAFYIIDTRINVFASK